MARVRSLATSEGGLPEDRSFRLGMLALIALRIAGSCITQHCCGVADGCVSRTPVYWDA